MDGTVGYSGQHKTGAFKSTGENMLIAERCPKNARASLVGCVFCNLPVPQTLIAIQLSKTN